MNSLKGLQGDKNKGMEMETGRFSIAFQGTGFNDERKRTCLFSVVRPTPKALGVKKCCLHSGDWRKKQKAN